MENRGVPAEERRARRRARLIDAALGIVAESGAASLRVRSVCATAELNDRYFYESFPDCRALLLATFDDQLAQVMESLDAVLERETDSPLEQTARAAVRCAFDFLDADVRRPPLLLQTQTSEALAERQHSLLSFVADILAAQIARRDGSRPVDDTRSLLESITVVGGLMEIVTRWFRGEIDIPRDDLETFVVETIADRHRAA